MVLGETGPSLGALPGSYGGPFRGPHDGAHLGMSGFPPCVPGLSTWSSVYGFIEARFLEVQPLGGSCRRKLTWGPGPRCAFSSVLSGRSGPTGSESLTPRSGQPELRIRGASLRKSNEPDG